MPHFLFDIFFSMHPRYNPGEGKVCIADAKNFETLMEMPSEFKQKTEQRVLKLV